MDTSFERSASGKDEWLTPPELVQALGHFDLDPCAPDPDRRPWETAARHFCRADNGLLREWEGRVWMNPPYGSHTGTWLGRLAEHGNGIALIFARTETKAFHAHIWQRADAVYFFEGRLTFRNVDGTPAPASAGAPSCLVAYGAANVASLYIYAEKHGGKVVKL